jgi:hypothetical protein
VNREDIIRMAREACDTDKVDAWHNGFWTVTQEELERFAALVAAAEREACAQVCEDKARTVINKSNTKTAINHCTAVIRARGEK